VVTNTVNLPMEGTFFSGAVEGFVIAFVEYLDDEGKHQNDVPPFALPHPLQP